MELFKKHPHTIRKPRKYDELNARRYWVILLCSFVLILAGELLYFSFYFLRITKQLDAPATPTLETNAAKIQSMQKRLDVVEETVRFRTGETSQNDTSVVQ